MKKLMLMAIVALMCVSASYAQTSFGVKVGGDMTNFWGKDTNHGMKPSYQAGVFLEHKFNDKVAVAPEVVFASQGGKVSNKGEIFGVKVNGDLTYNTNYVNIPVMLKYYVTPEFSIDLGPQLGVNVYSKATASGGIGSATSKGTMDLKDNTNAVDFGVGMGATFNVTSNVFVQGRYTMGLTNAFKGDVDCKNGNVQIAVGYRF